MISFRKPDAHGLVRLWMWLVAASRERRRKLTHSLGRGSSVRVAPGLYRFRRERVPSTTPYLNRIRVKHTSCSSLCRGTEILTSGQPS